MANHSLNKKTPRGNAGQGGGRSGSRHVYYTLEGRIAGWLDGNVLRKRVKGSIHQLRQPPAWALDAAILEAAIADGARHVVIEDAERGQVYRADIRLFDLHGFRFDRGFGAQVGLPLKFWHAERADAHQLVLLEV